MPTTPAPTSALRTRASGVPVLAALLIAAIVATLSLTIASTDAAAERDPVHQEFTEALDPHGEWIRHPRYGDTWVPYANEDPEWRPYSRGQWAYTEEHGWYWESEEEFGWVVYHYGRWTHDHLYRWMWVPGTEWAPAWVAWRQGEEAIGWAPLPPEAELGPDGELVYETFASPHHAPLWMFVAPAMLTMPAVYRHFYPRQRSNWYFGHTRAATSYGYRGGRIYNRGIDRGFIEHRARRPVPVLQVRPLTDPRDGAAGRRVDGDRQVGIYRPELGRRGGDPSGPGWSGRPPRNPGMPGRDFGGREWPGGLGQPRGPLRPDAGGPGVRGTPAGVPPAGGGEQLRRPPFLEPPGGRQGGPREGFGERDRPPGQPGRPSAGPAPGPFGAPGGAPAPSRDLGRDRERPTWTGVPPGSGPSGPPPGFGRDRERPSGFLSPPSAGTPPARPSLPGGDFGGRPMPQPPTSRPPSPPPAAQPPPPPRPQVQAPPPRPAAQPAPPQRQPPARREGPSANTPSGFLR